MPNLILEDFQCRGLQPLNLVLDAGECVALSGASGSGKTLLLRAIADLDPHSGEALIDNVRHSAVTAPDWRKMAGFLPAESHWWLDTVGEHFAHDPAELVMQLGFESDCLRWQVDRLSTGERQRLALARLLANKPGILLLDEPTANLDQDSVEQVETLIESYRTQHQVAVLWVSHSQAQRARVARRSLRIKDRKLTPEPVEEVAEYG